MLKLKNVTKRFGGLVAVNDVSFELGTNQVLGLIGPNGAGKTTTMNLISAYFRPDGGQIIYADRVLNKMKPHQIARLGIGRTFQIPRLFKKLTVYQNLLVPNTWKSSNSDEEEDKALKLLELFNLMRLKDEPAENLSGGQQKLVELARLSMLNPRVFLLDEPFHGIHPSFKDTIIDYIGQLKSNDTAFIVVSHDMSSVMRLCETLICMSAGTVISRGSPQEIQEDENVINAYLGG